MASIPSVGLVTNAALAPGGGLASQAAESGVQPFAALMTETLDDVHRLEANAQTTVAQLMTGNGVDVHQAMIAAEKASLAFEMVLSVRNKAMSAYQQVMNMQF